MIDLVKVLNVTAQKKEWVSAALERAEKYKNDPDKTLRLDHQLCVCCYYGSRLSGQAITRSRCTCCGEELMSSSTDTNALCLDCAKKYKLCVHCAADIELKNRRPRKADGTL